MTDQPTDQPTPAGKVFRVHLTDGRELIVYGDYLLADDAGFGVYRTGGEAAFVARSAVVNYATEHGATIDQRAIPADVLGEVYEAWCEGDPANRGIDERLDIALDALVRAMDQAGRPIQ